MICGPGENAGIIDIGDNDAIVFKWKLSNHPSFIEPYQVLPQVLAGIMRDILLRGKTNCQPKLVGVWRSKK